MTSHEASSYPNWYWPSQTGCRHARDSHTATTQLRSRQLWFRYLHRFSEGFRRVDIAVYTSKLRVVRWNIQSIAAIRYKPNRGGNATIHVHTRIYTIGLLWRLGRRKTAVYNWSLNAVCSLNRASWHRRGRHSRLLSSRLAFRKGTQIWGPLQIIFWT